MESDPITAENDDNQDSKFLFEHAQQCKTEANQKYQAKNFKDAAEDYKNVLELLDLIEL